MINQYVWLRSNLEKYQYHTEEAKKLHEEYRAIIVAEDGQLSDDSMNKLVDCYDRFVKMFNNNPFVYKNGLTDFDIETNDFDCYFIKSNDVFVPVGYYKAKHPVESVLLLSGKIEKQKKKTLDIKARLVEKFEKEAQIANEDYKTFKKEKKANYFRASVSVVAATLILWYSVIFFKITNIVEIIKNISDSQAFADSVVQGMACMPVFADRGIVGWIAFLIAHIILIIIVLVNIKNIKNEYVLAYQNKTAKRIHKTTQKSIERLNAKFDESLENDAQMLLALTRQGESAQLERGILTKIIKKTKNRLRIAEEYIKRASLLIGLRGIKKNKTVFFFVIVACLCCFSYTMMADSEFKNDFELKCYEIQVKMDKVFLRSKKTIQATVDHCPIYQFTSLDSKVKETVPIWTKFELVDTKTVNGERWSKIKRITGSDVIYGWIPTVYTGPYNKVDYNSFREVPIVDSDASSNLIDNGTEYLPEFAYDWKKYTSWQDGNEYRNGKGESLTLYFGEPTMVHMIQVFPGNAKSESLYRKNERIKKAKLKFSNGKSVKYEFDDAFHEPYQTIWLNKPVETEFVTIEIIDVYRGEEYNDLCISEIHVYSNK